MTKYIKEKKRVLKHMRILHKLSAEELSVLQAANSEIVADNIVRSFINKYL